jgi:Protein of unknown function (DUF2568)
MDDTTPRRQPAWVLALITLRFLLELALWSSFTVALVRMVDGWLGWVLGLAATGLVVVVWGLLLSPRRRVDLPFAARVAVELLLFALAALLLAAAGLGGWAVALVVVELVVLGLLRGPDRYAPGVPDRP